MPASVLWLVLALLHAAHAQEEGGQHDDEVVEVEGERARLEALRAELREEQQQQQPSGAIPGQAGVDYPLFSRVPTTSFSCADKLTPGYYADPETRCQAFHICGLGGSQHSFLCPGGSVFSQQYLVCDWWYSSVCGEEPLVYRDLTRLPSPETEQDSYVFLQEDIFHSAETGVPNRAKLENTTSTVSSSTNS